MKAIRGLYPSMQFVFCAILALIVPVSSNAGNGKIRLTTMDFGGEEITVGLVDLDVAVNWDPDDPDPNTDQFSTEDLQRQFRTASVMLCEATEGRFRLGKIRILATPSGNANADVFIDWTRGGGSHAAPGKLGVFGRQVVMKIYEDTPSFRSRPLNRYRSMLTWCSASWNSR